MAKEALNPGRLWASESDINPTNSAAAKNNVAVARALVNSPPVLLADEPTGNLDSATSEGIMKLFEKLHAEGQTIIIVTHEADIAARARRIVRMRDGQIVSDLSAEQDMTRQDGHRLGIEGAAR